MTDVPVAAGGYAQLLPIYLQEGMVVTGGTVSQHPWGSPAQMGVVGHDSTDPSRKLLVVAQEWPVHWLRSVDGIKQPELEWLHVQAFRNHCVIVTRQQPFTNVRGGADPPDVVVDVGDREVGMECMRLTISERQQAQARFRALRTHVMKVQPECFSALVGYVVYVWFTASDSGIDLPHRRGDDEAAEELVQALADYRPVPDALWQPSGEMPQQGPDLHQHETGAGATFYSAPLAGAAPASPLFVCAGFELALAYTTVHDADEEWQTLRAKIAEKDRDGNDWLLISAGAPDNHGTCYAVEETLADFLLDNPPVDDLHLTHLKGVTIHFWSTGKAVDLYPLIAPRFGPIFQGLAPTHYSLCPVPTSVPEGRDAGDGATT